MAYNEKLAERVRSALAGLPKLEEKPMFGGLAFMVDGKMCINISKDRLMCRIDPALHDEALNVKGTNTVMMRGKAFIGYIYVENEALKSKKEFDHWIELSLDFNKRAKSSRKQPKAAVKENSPAKSSGKQSKAGVKKITPAKRNLPTANSKNASPKKKR